MEKAHTHITTTLLPSNKAPVWIPILMGFVIAIFYLLLMTFSGASLWGLRQQWWFACGILHCGFCHPSRLRLTQAGWMTRLVLVWLPYYSWLGHQLKIIATDNIIKNKENKNDEFG